MFIVFDLDGTLADSSGRAHFLDQSPKDWNGWHLACVNDSPHKHTIEVYRALRLSGHKLEIWTGRSDIVAQETNNWLNRHVWLNQEPLVCPVRMRQHGNFTPDTELKAGWIAKHGRPDLVFEDRVRMVDMWRDLEIPCFHVDWGDF